MGTQRAARQDRFLPETPNCALLPDSVIPRVPRGAGLRSARVTSRGHTPGPAFGGVRSGKQVRALPAPPRQRPTPPVHTRTHACADVTWPRTEAVGVLPPSLTRLILRLRPPFFGVQFASPSELDLVGGRRGRTRWKHPEGPSTAPCASPRPPRARASVHEWRFGPGRRVRGTIKVTRVEVVALGRRFRPRPGVPWGLFFVFRL